MTPNPLPPLSERQRDRVALITGGGTGIGRAIALRLAAESARIAVAGRRPEPLQEVVRTIQAAGGAASAVPADIRRAEAARAMVATTLDRFGRLDALVVSAGRNARYPTARLSEGDFDDVVTTNLKGAFLTVQAAAPALAAQRRGRIVLMSSIGARVSLGFPVYDATKAALEALVRDFARELGPHGITVNAVSPGYILTPLTELILSDPTVSEALIRLTPRKRLGRLDDVTGAVAFLVSDEADYVTGQALVIDGGMTTILYWGDAVHRLGIGPLAPDDLAPQAESGES